MICNPYSNKSPSFTKLYILGAGGFAREVSWLTSQCRGNEVTSVFLVTKEQYLIPRINNVACYLLGIYWYTAPVVKLFGLTIIGILLFGGISHLAGIAALKDIQSLFEKKLFPHTDSPTRMASP